MLLQRVTRFFMSYKIFHELLWLLGSNCWRSKQFHVNSMFYHLCCFIFYRLIVLSYFRLVFLCFINSILIIIRVPGDCLKPLLGICRTWDDNLVSIINIGGLCLMPKLMLFVICPLFFVRMWTLVYEPSNLCIARKSLTFEQFDKFVWKVKQE